MSITVTDPKTGKTWTSGGRGRLPSWVLDMEKRGEITIPRGAPKVEKTVVIPEHKGLYVYKWNGNIDEDVGAQEQCVIVAKDEFEAIHVANKTFKHPVSMSELRNMWKVLEGEELRKVSIFVDTDEVGIWHVKNGVWEPRQEI